MNKKNYSCHVVMNLIVTVFALLCLAHNAQAAQNWTGDGGKGTSITILAPQATGLAENQSHLPALIQGEFISNFSTYSAIDVLDWQRREAIYVHILSSPSYSDSVQAQTARELGNLIPTTHFMDGKLIKTPTGYNLQVSIIRNSDKMTTASYSGNFTFWELNNLTGIRRASLELLPKIGVTLTTKAQQDLAGAAQANYVTAQTALARGVTAQRQGTEVVALSYYFQAAAFDPSLQEAVNRSSILNANITSGSMGDNIRSDIAWRRQWVERLKETEVFFDNFNKMESMPYTLFYTNDIKQVGAINYQHETANMSIETYLYGSGVWTLSIERALQAVWDGLNATGRKDTWELGSWPRRGVTDLNAFARRGQNFSVIFELVNDQNKVIGKQTLQAGGSWELNWSGRPSIVMSAADRKTLVLQNVNANDITDNMTIRVASVNGKDAESAAIDGVLQIRVITASEVTANDRFRFAKGDIQGFADRNVRATELVIPSVVWGDPVISIGGKVVQTGDTFVVSSSDGQIQIYRTVVIGGKRWMAENLNYQTSNSWCYRNDESNCQKYGRLYTWNAALSACPSGWRLPHDRDWANLVSAIGGEKVAGTKLKSKTGWNTGSGYIPGTDEFGFSALPGGNRYADGSVYGVGIYGNWWSATEYDAYRARYRYMYVNNRNVRSDWHDKSTGFSVRCLRD